MAEAELTPKEVGGFRILRRLASGATSDVLLARAEGPHGFQRVVALKILLARTQADPEFERQFAAEASAYARLSHPSIVKLYDFFSADGQLVMVLEFVDGLPLHKLRAMLAIGGERIDDRAALFLGHRMFSALAAAHSAKDPATGEFAPVVHHDVNPSNVLVPWDGHVKVGDFGMAKVSSAQAEPRAGFVKGTYGYIAPEQAAGETVSVRADVYSAGLILWELLARRKAVQRGSLSDIDVVKAMATPEYPPLDLLRPDVDAAVRDAVRRSLEPNPDKRSVSAEEMVNILGAAMPGEEGRVALSKALARIRPAGAGDPLAATPAAPVLAGNGAGSPELEKAATYPTVGEDGQPLRKIAFYGRIKLPSTPDQAAPTAPPAGMPRAVPRPVGDPPAADPSKAKKPSDFPTVRAPPLEGEDSDQATLLTGRVPLLAPLEGNAAPDPISTAPMTPAVSVSLEGARPSSPPGEPSVEVRASSPPAAVGEASDAEGGLAALVAEELAAAAEASDAPDTEQDPVLAADVPSPAVTSASATSPTVPPSRAPAQRGFPWGIAVAVSVVLGGGAAVFLLRGSPNGETPTQGTEPAAGAPAVVPISPAAAATAAAPTASTAPPPSSFPQASAVASAAWGRCDRTATRPVNPAATASTSVARLQPSEPVAP